jgi:ABC-type sulfate transport system permease subunit
MARRAVCRNYGSLSKRARHVEILYNEYDLSGAFAVASLLMLLAVATLVVKTLIEWSARSAGAHAMRRK